jgi:hypothetical protein
MNFSAANSGESIGNYLPAQRGGDLYAFWGLNFPPLVGGIGGRGMDIGF